MNTPDNRIHIIEIIQNPPCIVHSTNVIEVNNEIAILNITGIVKPNKIIQNNTNID